MTVAPLPLAARPYPGEAISSWLRRVAARYELAGDGLLRYLLGGRPGWLGQLGWLDFRSDPALEQVLAAAARLDHSSIVRLRIAGADGAAAFWHRTSPAWCPQCMQADLAAHGETYERAAWRLGCFVVCPIHMVILCDSCCGCPAAARCRFVTAGGRLRLACTKCLRVVDPARCLRGGLDDDRADAFDVKMAQRLTRLVRRLQRDLLAAFAGMPPRRWGLDLSAAGLLAVVRDLTASLVRSLGVAVAWQPDLLALWPSWGLAATTIVEPVSVAALAPRGAYGMMALIAAWLDGRTATGGADLSGKTRDIPPDITLQALVKHVAARERGLLWARSATWDGPLAAAFRQGLYAMAGGA